MVMLKVCVQVMVTEVVFDIDFRATSAFCLARSATEKLKQGWQNLALKVSLFRPDGSPHPILLRGSVVNAHGDRHSRRALRAQA